MKIAKGLANCSQFIVFISKDAVNSINVKKETFAAVAWDMNLLVIFIEDKKLPMDWDMNISIYQAIMYYKIDEGNFNLKIKKPFLVN